MLVGYMRVSTAEQNLALQRDALEAAGIAPERIYEDTCSGDITSRPVLARALDVAQEGDALVIWKLDRIGRSLRHVIEFVDGLQGRGIGLKVLTGGIDTTSSTGRLVFGIFATLAEFELRLRRLEADATAVRAALIEPWSSGQADGQIKRLELIKRQSYGRTGLALLQRRMILAI